MTALDVARTIARSEAAVTANQDLNVDVIARNLALGPNAALLVAELGTPVAVPGAPTSVAGVRNSNTSVSLSFSPPASDGGAGIDYYEATSTPGGFKGRANKSPVTVEAAFVQNVGYTFTVVAVNEKGAGAASGPSNQVLPFPP